ncbi:MAG TPA: amidohydrolase family protein, partial [Candidatus Limnocylindrales bacterium]|nr:amidohydrolase family protein [Candidatus Limnocylindrales bacterium]
MQRIRNVRIVDVANGSTSPPSSVVLGSGRIRSILGPGEPLAEGLDAGGRFLAPGLIDSHVHFFFDCGASPRTSFEASDDEARLVLARRNARVAIEAGITTMRDCGGPAPLVFELLREVAAGAVP